VLIDGKRVEAATQNGQVDLSQIPSAMIDHIEVLTGGASSTYGGDAVSGVVNIIMRKNFEGIEASGQYSVTKYNDGPTHDASIVMGANSADGKGNVTLYAEYYDQKAIPDNARPWGEHVLASPNGTGGGCTPSPGAGGFCYFGSSRIPQGWFTDIGQIFTPTGTLVPYAGQTFNFAPDEFIQSQHTRYALGADGHYEVNKQLDFYTRIMYSDNDNTNQLAPIAFSDAVSINCGNPYVTAQERTVLFPGSTSAADCAAYGGPDGTVTHNYRARFIAAGNRTTDIRNDQFQVLIGAKGDLGDGWSYDLSASYGQVQTVTQLGGDLNETNFDQTLLSDAIGTCSNGNPSCFPSNIFTTQTGISPLAAAYFKAPDQSVALSNEIDAQANLVGDLGAWGGKSPFAKDAIGIAVGAEYRQEKSQFQAAGPISFFGGSGGYGFDPPDSGAYNVQEGYAEVRVPVVEGVPFVESLEFDGGYRYSSYNLAGAANTWKAAITWEPTDDIKFRASQQRAVREPHISDLFGGATQNAANGYDPCGPVSTGQLQASLALCEATGVTAGQYQSAGLNCGGQCNSYLTSNPALRPEVGTTRTLGVVLTPTFLDGFTTTIDYYFIDISGAINSLPFQTVMNGCYSPALNPTQSPTNAFCQLIHRDQFGSFNSSAGFADLPLYNIGSQGAKGFNFESHYRLDMSTFSLKDAGSFGFDFFGTWALNQEFYVSGQADQCAGHYDANFCDVPTPRWRHQLRVTWYSPDSNVSVYGTWRFLTATNDEELLPSGPSPDPLDATLPSVSYFDLGGNWNIDSTVTLYGGVTNVLNKKPPLLDDQVFSPATENDNTFPGVYDVMGATFFVGVHIKA